MQIYSPIAQDSLVVSGSMNVSGSVTAQSFTGSFSGTASYASTALTASYALTASVALNVPATASYAIVALTASYANFAVNTTSASFAVSAALASQASNASSASFATNAGTAGSASFATNASNAASASYALTASYTTASAFSFNATSASYALSASFALSTSNAVSASFATNAANASSASYALNSSNTVSASFARSASYAMSASYATASATAITASHAIFASTAASASFATNASTAASASFATNAGTAGSASYAVSASYATASGFAASASYALNASNAVTASHALNSVSASYALFAANTTSASYALSASYAFNSSVAVSASFSTNAGFAGSASYAQQANTASSADNFTVRGTLTATNIVVQTITSSQSTITGSTKFGSIITNTHQFTGSVLVTGSINVIDGVTNNLTASWAVRAISSSFASNASTAASASFATNASTAASASFATSAANATTASHAINAVTASFALNSQNAFVQGGNSFGAQALLGTNDAQNLALETNGTVRMVISGSNGFVGIGTTNPSRTFHVYGGANTNSTIRLDTTGSGSPNYTLTTLGQQDWSMGIDVGDSGKLKFDTNTTVGAATRVTFDGGGNVGIGTTAPQSLLSLGSGVNAQKLLLYDANNNFKYGFGIQNNELRQFYPSDGFITFGTISTSNGTTFIERMRISSGGNVGIGTPTPTQQLVVSGSGSDTRIEIGSTTTQGIYFTKNGVNNGTFRVDTNGNYEFYTKSVSQAVVITSGGDVGIGTTSPQAKFHLWGGDMYITNTTNPRIVLGDTSIGGDWGAIQWNSASDLLQLGVGPSSFSPVITINESLNVGIGTTSPNAKLDIVGASNTPTSFGTLLIKNSSETGISFGASSTSYAWIQGNVYGNSYNLNLVLNAQGGNVGIGTTAPAYLLDVNGDIFIRGNNSLKSSTNGNIFLKNITSEANSWIYQEASADWGMFAVNNNTQLNALGGIFAGSGLVTFIATAAATGVNLSSTTGGGASYGVIAFDHSAGKAYFAGSVGIGTTAPVAKLHIIGPTLSTSSETTYPLWLSDTGDNTKALILGFDLANDIGIIQAVDQAVTWKNIAIAPTSGNVGIGTINPQVTFQVNSTLTGGGLAHFVSTGIESSITFRTGSQGTNTGWVTGQANNAYFIYSQTLASQAMTILSNGDVGIGSTSPGYKLDVNGNVFAANYYVQNSGGTGGTFRVDGFQDYLYFYGSSANTAGYRFGSDIVGVVMHVGNNGSVGIGTTSPTQLLDVRGKIYSIASGTDGGQIILANSGGGRTWYWAARTNGLNLGELGVLDGRMFVETGSGNLGVGTVNPIARLDVRGPARIGGSNEPVVIGSYTDTFTNFYSIINSTNNGDITFASNLYNNNKDLVTATTHGSMTGGAMVIWGNGAALGANTIAFYAQAPGTATAGVLVSGSNTSMVIRSGNVGIGSNSPNAKLRVEGTTILNGDVGIGVTPAVKLDVNGSVYVRAGGILYIDSLRGYTSGVLSTTLSELALSSNFSITGGNVGINTTAPTNKLRIQGGNEVPLYIHNTGTYASLAFTGDGGTTKAGLVAYNNLIVLGPLNAGGTGVDNGLYMNTSSLNVGIGTQTPTQRLEVNGSVKLTSGGFIYGDGSNADLGLSNNNGSILRYGGVSVKVLAASVKIIATSEEISLQNNGGTIWMNASGNVGIGTTNPSVKLHVFGSAVSPSGGYSVADIVIEESGEAALGIIGTTYSSIYFGDAATALAGGIVYYHSNNSLGFRTNDNTDKMNITSGGNVGIGTTTPNSQLQVGNVSTSGTGITIAARYDQSDAFLRFRTGHPSVATIWEMGNIAMNDDGNFNGIMHFRTANTGADTPTTKMVIRASGNVGIGITSPSGRFEVAGGSGATGVQSYFSVNAGFTAPAAGNASFPGGAKIILWNDAGTPQKASIGMDSAADIWFNNAGGQSGAGFTFYTGDGASASPEARLKIAKNGNIGIGNTSPGYKLHISGQTYINNGSNNALFIDTTVADNTTRDAIYLYENDGQATGRQAISWYNGDFNGNVGYYKARIWTEVGSGYNVTQFGIDVANNARTLATRLYINNGDTYHSGDVIAYASDFRLKENIKPIENALDKIQKVSGVHYQWKDKVTELGFEPTTKQDIGVIAQEIQAVLPEAVKPAPFDYIGGSSKSGENYLTVQYEKIVPLLIEAIKELKAEIDELKNNKK
jgi:hypothetical protein